MAQIHIEEIVEQLSSEMRLALEDAVIQVAPDADISSLDLFQAFKRAVADRCNAWENVPDGCVRA